MRRFVKALTRKSGSRVLKEMKKMEKMEKEALRYTSVEAISRAKSRSVLDGLGEYKRSRKVSFAEGTDFSEGPRRGVKNIDVGATRERRKQEKDARESEEDKLLIVGPVDSNNTSLNVVKQDRERRISFVEEIIRDDGRAYGAGTFPSKCLPPRTKKQWIELVNKSWNERYPDSDKGRS